MVGDAHESAIQGSVAPLNAYEPSERAGMFAPSHLLGLARRKPLGVAAFALLLVLWVLCLLAPVIAPYGYDQLYTAPRLLAPTSAHIFGTDESGRDVFSRLLFAGRLSLVLSLVTTVGGVALAVLVGVVSGYAAGWFDLIFQRITDACQALPILVILLVLAALYQGNRVIVLTAIALLFAPAAGRLFRSATLVLRDQPFIEAARVVGASPMRVILTHIMPNLYPLTSASICYCSPCSAFWASSTATTPTGGRCSISRLRATWCQRRGSYSRQARRSRLRCSPTTCSGIRCATSSIPVCAVRSARVIAGRRRG
jgi:ABC-type dipeptide/oligopeptide/nickel transport system permease subunit